MAENLTPSSRPGSGGAASSPSGNAVQAGTPASNDPSVLPGQYPASLFGAALPQGTGAPGSAGASGAADPTNQPGQLEEGISGSGPGVVADTGAPGTSGAQNAGPQGQPVTYTLPGSYLSGTYKQDTVTDSISGVNDWTQSVDGSYGGGPQLPGIQGNMPAGTGAGDGRVLRGGREVHG